MTRLKAAALWLGFAVLSGSAAIPSFAFYHAATDTAENALSIPETIHFTFLSNGGTGSMGEISIAKGSGNTLPANHFSREDHLFTGWNTQADGSGTDIHEQAPIDSLVLGDTHASLFAQWESEAGDLLEPQWDRNLSADKNKNGVPDRLELKAGSTFPKDPSLKNHTAYDSYGYILVSVPVFNGQTASDSSDTVQDAVSYTVSDSWTEIKTAVSVSPSEKSKYLYRYNSILKAYGSAESNPYHPLRRADRSTNLFNSIKIKNFISTDDADTSVDVTGLFIDSSASQSDADQMAYESFVTAGLF